MRANGYKTDARRADEPLHDSRTAAEKVRAIVDAIHTCQGDYKYTASVGIFYPTADIVAWAVAGADLTTWGDNQYKPGTGSLYVGRLVGCDQDSDVQIHDIPKGMVVREAPPLPTCGECGSVVCKMGGGACVAAMEAN